MTKLYKLGTQFGGRSIVEAFSRKWGSVSAANQDKPRAYLCLWGLMLGRNRYNSMWDGPILCVVVFLTLWQFIEQLSQ